MKTIHRLARKLLTSAIVLSVVGLAAQAMADSVVAKVIGVKGAARCSINNKDWKNVNVGDVLKPGTVIQTAEKSHVDIQLGVNESGGVKPISNSGASGSGLYDPEEQTGNVVRLSESSVLSLDKLTSSQTGADAVEETQLDLRAGRIMGNVKKLSAASKYEVKIPNGVAGIRGTIYLISSSGFVQVLAGSVVVAVVGADGSVVTQVIGPWHQYDPTTGSITEIPPGQRGDLIHEANDLHHGQTPPTSYPLDHTIVYVTPTDGNGQGQNNNK